MSLTVDDCRMSHSGNSLKCLLGVKGRYHHYHGDLGLSHIVGSEGFEACLG